MSTNIYGYSELWVFKINLVALLKVLKLYFFLKFWAVKICGLKFVGTQNMWVLKSVDIMKYQIL